VGQTVNRTKLPFYILRYSISLDRRRFDLADRRGKNGTIYAVACFTGFSLDHRKAR